MVSKGEIRPDPDRMKSLYDLPPPRTKKGLKRILGLFSYYSQWINNFSAKIRPLISNIDYPLNCEALDAFNLLKRDIANATLRSIDESLPFLVETDASNYAIAATLSQQGRPVAFFFRTLNRSELKHSTIEKEAAAIIEAVRKWKHYLTGRRFSLITDQTSVSYMFNTKHNGKIKNDKIMRWRIELSTYDFDIIYRCGEENIPADALSRLNCVTMNLKKLQDLHNSLCHPGVTRLAHFVKQRNLPFSLDQVRQVVRSCSVCRNQTPIF